MGGNIIINNPHLYYYYKNSFLKTLRPNEFFLKPKVSPLSSGTMPKCGIYDYIYNYKTSCKCHLQLVATT
jgi:hypothetical protein